LKAHGYKFLGADEILNVTRAPWRS